MFSSKKKRQKQRDPPDAALLSSLSVLYAFIDEHRVPWLYRDCADDKGKTKIIKALAKCNVDAGRVVVRGCVRDGSGEVVGFVA